MRKYRLSVLVYLLFIFQFLHAQKVESTFQVVLKDNEINIVHNGIPRLSSGNLFYEGVEFKVSKVSSGRKGNEEIVQLSGPQKKNSSIRVNTTGNVIAFSMDPNKNNSPNGQKFLGLFFDLPQFKIGTSLYRYGESKAWTKPVAVRKLSDLDSVHNQFFYWQYQDSLYAVAIPLGGKGYSASLGRAGLKVGAKSYSLVDNYFQENIPLMAIAFGKDLYPLIDEVMERGMEMMGYPENLRKKKQYPAILENFGWCTWDAFGHKINVDRIIEGVESFKKYHFPVPFVLIDDGWLKVGEDMKLKSHIPDSVKFPDGFKPLVNRLKKEYKVKDVGIWHTINAYWKGVDTASTLGKEYKGQLYSYRGKLPWSKDTLETYFCPTPKNESGMKFFDDWYNYLSNEGISFIKVDNQLVVRQISNNQWPLWNTGQQLQKNFQVPAAKYFQGNVINCMEMTTDDIYHFGKSAIARASDDYMPKEITYNLENGNAAVHVTNCLYNSLWLSPIVWPDFDMFESYQLYPEYHAIARAISGGPIYVSDWPGEQNFDVLWPLITQSGKILRTDFPARLTEDCLFQVQDPKPLKAYSFSGNAALLGIWNVSNTGFVNGSFKTSDIKGLAGEKFAVYEHFTQKSVALTKAQEWPISMTRMDYRLYTIVPLQHDAAVIGLLNKYNSPKTVMSQKVEAGQIEIRLVEGGILGIHMNALPKKVMVNNQLVQERNYTYTDGLLKVNIPLEDYPGELKVKIER